MIRLFFICLFLSFGLAGCSEERAAKPKPAAPVQTARVEKRTMPYELIAVGSVAASHTVGVRSRVTGELMQVLFTEGDNVAEGQALFVIDKRPFEALLQESRARLESSRARLAKAQDDVQRFQRLATSGYTSQEQLQQAKTDMATLSAAVLADEAAVQSASLQLNYCTITAPIQGRAGALGIDRGNMIKANDEKYMVTIDTLEPVYVNFAVPEHYVPRLLQSHAKSPLSVTVSAEGVLPVSATIDFIDNSVDMRTGTIKLRAVYPNASRQLWPGLFVRIKLTLEERDNALVVPSRAVLSGPSGSYVYIVDAEQKSQHRLVRTSFEAEGAIIIEEGLNEGDVVVTEGHVRLAPGVAVSVPGNGASK